MSPAVGTMREGDLAKAFANFTEVAERLEAAYGALRRSTSRIDGEIAEANRKLQEQVGALQNLAGSLAAVLRSIPCGVVVSGRRGEILMINPAAESILGEEATNLLGRAADSLAGIDGEPLLRLPQGPGPSPERNLRTARGTRTVDGCVARVLDVAGTELGLLEVLNDRTEVGALRAEVERLNRFAELGRVAGGIAHEIRNPLSGIRGFAGLLERHLGAEDGNDTARRWARRILEGVADADRIIERVLFLARPNPLERRRVAARRLLDETLEALSTARPALFGRVRVRRRVHPPRLSLDADPVRLRQALTNLAQNALEAMEGTGTLELAATREGNDVRFAVKDDGPGVPASVRETVFEPFVTTKSGGSGLGLALVHRIASAHGGRVSLESRDGGGATFELRIPVSQGARR